MRELPAVFDASIVRSRKEHCCCECSRTIPRGQKYLRNRGLWDGHWDEFKQCLRCARLFKVVESDLWNVWHDDGPCFGELRDCLFEYPWPQLKDVFRRARNQLTEGE